MNSILVPVDFSKNSENAVRFALMIGDRLKAKLYLFHSYYSPHASGHINFDEIESSKKIGHDTAVFEMSDLFTRCAPTGSVTPEYITSPRELRDVLPEIIRKNGIELVVMGTQGIGWLEGKIFGTNTSWTIENINCPVIAIPEKEVNCQINHITYASECIDSDIVNLKTVVSIAEKFEADVTIIHIEPYSVAVGDLKLIQFKEKLKNEIKQPDFEYRTIEASNVEGAIEDYMKHHQVDLLVMSAQQRDLYDKLFGKSITKLMAQRLSSPIMFFHHK